MEMQLANLLALELGDGERPFRPERHLEPVDLERVAWFAAQNAANDEIPTAIGMRLGLSSSLPYLNLAIGRYAKPRKQLSQL